MSLPDHVLAELVAAGQRLADAYRMAASAIEHEVAHLTGASQATASARDAACLTLLRELVHLRLDAAEEEFRRTRISYAADLVAREEVPYGK